VFVVRISPLEGANEFRAFERRSGALKIFNGALCATGDGDIEGAALFEVPDVTHPLEAIEAVRAGKAVLLNEHRNSFR
jgi:hypothetical protein